MREVSTHSQLRGCLAHAFINTEERRLRAGWRLLCYGALFLLGASVVLPLLSLLPLLRRSWSLPAWGSSLLFYSVQLAATLLLTWLARRFLDRRPLRDLGLRTGRGWCSDLLFGVALGGTLMGAIALIAWVGGWLQPQGYAWQTMSWGQLLPQLTASFVLYLAVGISEELAIRGYVMHNLADGLSMPWAVFISSALFGLLHMGNPNASWVSTFNIAVAGVLMAAGVLVTGSLWMSIGLHFGWNFFQGTIFGFPVSGTGGFHLIRHTVVGPEWLTGGPFGPEAGLTGLAAMILGTALIWLFGRARSGVQNAG